MLMKGCVQWNSDSLSKGILNRPNWDCSPFQLNEFTISLCMLPLTTASWSLNLFILSNKYFPKFIAGISSNLSGLFKSAMSSSYKSPHFFMVYLNAQYDVISCFLMSLIKQILILWPSYFAPMSLSYYNFSKHLLWKGTSGASTSQPDF